MKDYCREHGLSPSGSKQEITQRIAHYMDTGEKLKPARKAAKAVRLTDIMLDSIIEENIKFSELHRTFFKEAIGEGFTFKVAFQQWLKQNSGKTYRQAVEAYYEIKQRKKESTSVIPQQFEYNTYIRDFFADNPGLRLEDAICCWKYKKSQLGHNRYEKADVTASQAWSNTGGKEQINSD